MQTTLLLVRHGETDWAKHDRFTGISDIDLNQYGQIQASALSQYIARFPYTTIYSSPLRRTQATANLLNTHKVPIILDHRIREIDYGRWEGLHRDEIKRRYGAEYAAWSRDPEHGIPPEGESGRSLAERVTGWWEEIYRQHSGQCIVAVAHRTVNRILLCTLLGIPIADYRRRIGQSPCALNIIYMNENGPLVDKLNMTIEMD